MRRNSLSVLKSAVQLATLYVPLLFFSDLIETVCPFADISAQSLVSGGLCFCVLFSDSAKTTWKKWGCSFPFTLLFAFLLAKTKFDVRLINQLFPGYGSLSAGAGFAFVLKFVCFTAAQGLAALLAVACGSSIKNRKLKKLCAIVQEVCLPLICAIIALIVLYLEWTMPTWETIYQAAYC